MATGIERLWLRRSRSRQPRLRWALPHESHWDRRQNVDEMWREIASGQRPCLCAVSLDDKRRQRRPVASDNAIRIGGD